jgi:hypothetical protein
MLGFIICWRGREANLALGLSSCGDSYPVALGEWTKSLRPCVSQRHRHPGFSGHQRSSSTRKGFHRPPRVTLILVSNCLKLEQLMFMRHTAWTCLMPCARFMRTSRECETYSVPLPKWRKWGQFMYVRPVMPDSAASMLTHCRTPLGSQIRRRPPTLTCLIPGRRA